MCYGKLVGPLQEILVLLSCEVLGADNLNSEKFKYFKILISLKIYMNNNLDIASTHLHICIHPMISVKLKLYIFVGVRVCYAFIFVLVCYSQ